MKQNQVIAICDGVKSKTKSIITQLHHKVQKEDFTSGFFRTYQPKDDEGEKLPDEKKMIQLSVFDAFEQFVKAYTELFDLVGTQEKTNTTACADITIDEVTVLKDVPVTYLLFLEKQFKDIETFISKLPVLDPVEEWTYDANNMYYTSKTKETSKSKKVMYNHVVAEATKEHPAQVQVYAADEIIGYWKTTKISGAIPKKEQTKLLEKVDKIQKAIKLAREEANGMEAVRVEYGKDLLNYLFN